AMQESVTHPETARHIHEEHLDTKAMDHLLTRLEPADKDTSPTARRAKLSRRIDTKSLTRAAAGRRVPSFVLSPRRSHPAPRGSAPEFQFFFENPREPKIANDSLS